MPGSVRAWAFYFLSTSNYSLMELASRAGLELDDAERGRLSDIPCPNAGHGLYEELHDFQDGEALSDTLKSRCRKYFGSSRANVLSKTGGRACQAATRVKAFSGRGTGGISRCLGGKANQSRLATTQARV